MIGRNFLPEEDRAGGPPAAILSYSLWQRRFGGDRSVLGKSLTLDSKSHIIVGVLPDSFRIPDRFAFREGSGYDVWAPFALSDTEPRFTLVQVIGRLQPGVRIEVARAELDSILQPTVRKGRNKHVVLAVWQDEIAGGARQTLLFFLAAVGLVLLIAGVNVANLLLARAAAREREMAVRLALGASRPRIVRQLLTESVLLSLFGAVLGLAIALAGKGVLVSFISATLPIVDPIGIDFRVLGFTVGLALMTGLAFGSAPAVQGPRVQLNEWLKVSGCGAGRHRHGLRDALVVSEVALAMIVLIGAGLLLKSYLLLRSIDLGYKPKGLLSLTVDLSSDRYSTPRDQAAFYRLALEQINGLPGVESASAVSSLPLGLYSSSATITIEGRAEPTEQVSTATVAPAYFRTMGIPLLLGRALADFDREGSPEAVVVNDSFSRRFFPGESCLGKRLSSWNRENEWMTIVGVVGDVRPDPDAEVSPEVYVSYLQFGLPSMYIVLRTSGNPLSMAGTVRSLIAGIDKTQPAYDFMTMEGRRAESLAPRRINTFLLGAFAALALVLGSIGIYGVVSYSFSQRTREIGVRLALGARRSHVLGLVIKRCLLLVLAGEILGLAVALALNRLMSSLVFSITTTDPLTYSAAAIAWMIVAMLACYVPARRAMRVDPMVALRYE